MDINETNVNTEAQEQETTEAKTFTFTEEEFAALLQRETDKRVTSALKTQQKKYEKQLSLSKLDDEAREKAMKDARIQELEEMLRDRDIANNKSELKSVLSARGLSAEFADIITISEDIEESQAKIDVLDKLFKAAVKNEVERRLAGSVPKGSNATQAATITKETLLKMNVAELQTFKAKQPELYKSLINN